MSDEKLYTLEEVQDYFRVSGRTIRKFIRLGILRGFKAGKDWRYTRQDILDAQQRLRERTHLGADGASAKEEEDEPEPVGAGAGGM